MRQKKGILLISSLLLLRVNSLFQERKTNGLDVSAEKILILGSGGTLGAVWQVGTILRLMEEGLLSIDEFDLRIGTSAGSLALSIIDSDLTPDQIEELITTSQLLYKGKQLSLPGTEYIKERGKLNNPKILLNALKYLQLPRFNNVLSGFIPEGYATLDHLGDFIDTLHPTWPERATFITASDLETGRRVVFNNLSNVRLSQAVRASCAVPGVFKPIHIKGIRYIDGGVHSSINYDLAVKAKASQIVILTPSSGFVAISLNDPPLTIVSKIYRNLMEFHLRRIELFCYLKRISLTVLRPRDLERDIMLESGSLLNEAYMTQLFKESKRRVD